MIATTVYGFEDICARELVSFGAKILQIMDGKVVFEGNLDLIYAINMGSRTVHRVGLLIDMGDFTSLEEIKQKLSRVDFSNYIGKDCTFEVRFKRFGVHNFRSIDANSAIGAVIHSQGYKVNLTQPDVSFKGWIHGNRFYFCLDTTGESLHRRNYRVCNHPAPLRPTIAALMSMWLSWKDTMLDPFCGSGTILVEGLWERLRYPPNVDRKFAFEKLAFFDREYMLEIRERLLEGVSNGNFRAVGVELFKKHVDCCRRILRAAGVEDKAVCVHGDGCMYCQTFDGSWIITNPPYGLRISSAKKATALMKRFANVLRSHFSGTAIVITPSNQIENLLSDCANIDKRIIRYGDLWVRVYRITL
ncbi:MAG: RNA methyltransferase [Thermoplasmata archaeon]|nr:MAG: RNA methyltransferase [Thermoplasmata archaeon]